MNTQRLLMCGLIAIATGLVSVANADAQWRTRYVRRDGLFHVEKYRTGNGITPAFAGVITTAITTAPEIIAAVQGQREIDDSERQQSRAVADPWRERYAEQQRRANDLLDRTANLVNYSPPTNTTIAPSDPQPLTPADIGTQTNQQESGENPWELQED